MIKSLQSKSARLKVNCSLWCLFWCFQFPSLSISEGIGVSLYFPGEKKLTVDTARHELFIALSSHFKNTRAKHKFDPWSHKFDPWSHLIKYSFLRAMLIQFTLCRHYVKLNIKWKLLCCKELSFQRIAEYFTNLFTQVIYWDHFTSSWNASHI